MFEVNLAVVFLAALTSIISTMFIHWQVGKRINKGVVLSGISNSIVGKATGVELVVIDAIFWAAVTTALSLAFENVYNNNLDKIPFSYVGVIAFIALGARISIGGKYSWKGIMACALTLIIGGLFFLYGIGAHIQGLF